MPHGLADVVLDTGTPVAIQRKGSASEELVLASEILERYLPRCLNKAELAGGSGTPVKIELEARALAWTGLPKEGLGDLRDLDAFEVEVAEQPSAVVRIKGATVLSTCYGAVHFLEKHLGVRWLFPGDLGLALPEAGRFSLKAGVEKVRPSLVSRLYTGIDLGDPVNMGPFRARFAQTPLQAERAFFQASDYYRSLKMNHRVAPSHAMIGIFPIAETAANAPELFPMLEDGSRPAPKEGTQNWHPCYTNPKAVEIAVAKARKAFDEGALCFSLGINDGKRTQCACPPCKAAGWPGAYYQFVTKVADALKGRYPPHLVGVLVYGDVRHPPDDLRLPPNVFAMVSGASKVSKWGKIAPMIGRYDYFYGEGFLVPSFPLAALAHNAKAFAANRVVSHRAETRPVWAFDGPKLFIQSRLWWDPTLDPRALLRDWCAAAFGPAGEEMAALYEHWAGKWDYLAKDAGAEPSQLCDMGRWNSTGQQFALVKPGDFDATRARLEKAGAAAMTAPQLARFEMVKAFFDRSRAFYALSARTDGIFAGAGVEDLAKEFEALCREKEEADRVDAFLDSRKEYYLGTKNYPARPGYTVENQIHSGVLTALMRLRGQPGFAARAASIPASLAPYAGPMNDGPVSRIKPSDTGTYYALPEQRHVYVPMKYETGEDGITYRTAAPNARVEEGSYAGSWQRHWGFFSISSAQGEGIRLYRCDVEAKGAAGDLAVRFDNPWRAEKEDRLPIEVVLDFGETPGALKRTVYFEPVTVNSPRREQNFAVRGYLLWQPENEKATCSATLRFTQVNVQPAAAPKKK
jgi:hypothetical protein